MAKKVIVLGGNGFIGKNLIPCLLNKYDVISFSRNIPDIRLNGVEYVKGDFFNDDELLLHLNNYDIIIDLISSCTPSSSSQNPIPAYSQDIGHTIIMLEYLKEKNVKILFASSGGTVYGEPKTCPVNEKATLQPLVHYGIIKSTLEKILYMYRKIYGINSISMRISNPYGPWQDYLKGVGIIDAIIKQGMNDEEITVYGTGDVVRDYIYIDDVCHAIVKLCEYDGEEHVFNISSGTGNSINDIIKIASRIMQHDLKVRNVQTRKNDVHTICLDNNLLKQEVGFYPKVGIDEGIEKYFQWLKKHQ